MENTNHLKTLNNARLNQKIKQLAETERQLTKEILICISEIDKRKIFLAMAYPSLFEYLTKEIGYSAGAAQRRIDAARLIQQIPEVSEQIKNGHINLSQISKMQKACRQIKKETGHSPPTTTQLDVLKKLENQVTQQTDLILAQELNLKIQTEELQKTQKDESVRIELTFSKAEAEILSQAQKFLSNKTGTSLKNAILEMAKGTIKKLETKNSTATVAVRHNLKTLTPKIKKTVLNRDQCCQFKDKLTGKLCGSKYFLQIDHIHPKYAGGDNSLTNLRVLCANHNRYRYQMGS